MFLNLMGRYHEVFDGNFEGEWWEIETTPGKRVSFQLTTTFENPTGLVEDDSPLDLHANSDLISADDMWSEDAINSPVKLNLWIEDGDVYHTTYLGFEETFFEDAGPEECTLKVSARAQTELWVNGEFEGSNIEHDRYQGISVRDEDCDEDNLALLQKGGDEVATPAAIAVPTAAALAVALTAYCAFKVSKRGNVDDYFGRA